MTAPTPLFMEDRGDDHLPLVSFPVRAVFPEIERELADMRRDDPARWWALQQEWL